jgi:Fe-S cluster biogenesis protein NfuA
MFIQTEETPNPATLKFMPGMILLESQTACFNNAEEAHPSPLAQRLFKIEGVQSVFIGNDFVSITKEPSKEWYVVKPMILGALMEHLVQKLPILTQSPSASSLEEDSEVVAQIKELLDTKIRPAVAMDGGDIVFSKFEDGIVYLHMQGACSGCPSSTATLKSGIENMLKHYIPEVLEVRSI